MKIAQFQLRSGVSIPAIGLGLYQTTYEQLKIVIPKAIEIGYRLFDTASFYDNEKELGKELGKAMKNGLVARKNLFITSKIWNDQQGYDKTLKAFETSLKKLNLEYLDLYLIHWPINDKLEDTWKALVELHNERRIRAIGVSNFQIHHLQKIMSLSSHYPQLNQIEVHPHLTQQNLLDFCNSHSIAVQAWSPLGRGRFTENSVLNDIAQRHKKTLPKIILRWHYQRGLLTIPKTTHVEYLSANVDIFDFELSQEESQTIDDLNQNLRYGPDPETFGSLV